MGRIRVLKIKELGARYSKFWKFGISKSVKIKQFHSIPMIRIGNESLFKFSRIATALFVEK